MSKITTRFCGYRQGEELRRAKACSHQAKAKKIKEQSEEIKKTYRQTSKKIFAVAFARCEQTLKARLHQASAMLQQLCDDASNSVLIEINGDAWKWVTTPFWSFILEFILGVTEQGRSIAFYSERCLCNNCRYLTDAWCKRTLRYPWTASWDRKNWFWVVI